MENKTEKEIKNYIVDFLSTNLEYAEDYYREDLHNKIFNTDYFIIGCFDAEEWLKNYPGIFDAIETIKEYEQNNFGEVSADFSESEHVCNMYTYICGEEVLYNLKSYNKFNSKYCNKELFEDMIKELEQ
jgi:hypothetical protein